MMNGAHFYAHTRREYKFDILLINIFPFSIYNLQDTCVYKTRFQLNSKIWFLLHSKSTGYNINLSLFFLLIYYNDNSKDTQPAAAAAAPAPAAAQLKSRSILQVTLRQEMRSR